MLVDEAGFRLNIGVILIGPKRQLFWGKRIGQNAWQFPQGGLLEDESPLDGMYRELYEEIGLSKDDVKVLATTKGWLSYRLPKQYLRKHSKPLVIGQKQKWFLLRLMATDQKLRFDVSEKPEFDSWRWVKYWQPLKDVIYFKRRVYKRALLEFEPILFPKKLKRIVRDKGTKDTAC